MRSIRILEVYHYGAALFYFDSMLNVSFWYNADETRFYKIFGTLVTHKINKPIIFL